MADAKDEGQGDWVASTSSEEDEREEGQATDEAGSDFGGTHYDPFAQPQTDDEMEVDSAAIGSHPPPDVAPERPNTPTPPPAENTGASPSDSSPVSPPRRAKAGGKAAPKKTRGNPRKTRSAAAASKRAGGSTSSA